MTAYHPPSSKSVVNLPDSLAERYVAAGWTAVEAPSGDSEEEKPRPVKRPARKRTSSK